MTDRKLCIIGAGKHSQAHIYPCLRQLTGASVVANCALQCDSAEAVARAYGIPRSYDDYRLMVEKERPDGVILCVGPAFHAAVAIELMNQGFHVYCEKPPAETLRETLEVAEVQARTGRVYMVGFKKRWAPAYRKTKEIIESARFGRPALLSMLRTWGNYALEDDPRGQYIMDSGIHAIDLVTYLFGSVARVSAMFQPGATYAVTLQFENGAVGTLNLTDRMTVTRPWEQLTVIGGGAVCIQVDNSTEMLAFQGAEPFAAHKPEFGAGYSDSQVEMGFVDELQGFIDAIEAGEATQSTIHDAVRTMALIEAIQTATRTGGIVTPASYLPAVTSLPKELSYVS